jgi:hypothetical protein
MLLRIMDLLSTTRTVGPITASPITMNLPSHAHVEQF